jgi:hypothetical protein
MVPTPEGVARGSTDPSLGKGLKRTVCKAVLLRPSRERERSAFHKVLLQWLFAVTAWACPGIVSHEKYFACLISSALIRGRCPGDGSRAPLFSRALLRCDRRDAGFCCLRLCRRLVHLLQLVSLV